MCMEDVRLARQTTTRVTQVTGDSGVWVLVAQQDPDRWSLVIQFQGGSDVQLSCGASGLPQFAGSVPTDAVTVFMIDLLHYGDMVTQPWYIYSGSSSVLAVVTESSLRIR